MQKWRTIKPKFPFLISTPSSTQPRCSPPFSFSPHLLFSRSIPRPSLTWFNPTNCSPITQIHSRSGIGISDNSQLKPSQIPYKEHRRTMCFKCGGYGHIAKICKLIVRCYCCGSLGYRRQKCLAVEKKMLRSLAKEEIGDCSSNLILFSDRDLWNGEIVCC